jgi:transcriptional regulator with XRE-family HTH domain
MPAKGTPIFAKKTPNTTDKHVGARVRLRREELGITQETLGKECGITFQQIQKYEKAMNRIGSSRLQHIANFLKVPVAFFFEGLPKPDDTDSPSCAYLNDFITSSDGLALTKAFMRIADANLRRRIVDMVEAIVDAEDDGQISATKTSALFHGKRA